MNELTNRVALVTGGSRGIGAAIVRRFVADGMDVAFTYASSESTASALADDISAQGGIALPFRAETTDAGAFEEVVESVLERFGRLDVLVNNVGGGIFAPLTELPVAEIDKMIDINVRALVMATRTVIPVMKTGGRIINIGSVNADRTPFPGGSVYALTKGAVPSFTRALSRELGPLGITVNNVQPGPTDTDANPADGPGADALRSHIAVGRYGHVDDLAGMVSYLASAEAGFVTGATLNVDGGFSA
ncbi:SDR family NAD(P)-dependent oxidoreductase [Herbiconiux sp. VKM Ac-2851]|uniref:SDR family NAD(P)-dependent oxidoreductase n=1 Tax=Herbiconiux sp. VKM Ac-2851 TaxID=2739025 RepID=UPI0015676784|nr:3-oxoacyl-ACP reductase family protein [Herbiconiux sp. VKM Ac-2851]NQX37113.1 3-oxoacyl-ACP reductase FabG [Herbiconiux sp. VKM Ac-2851]